MRRADAIGAVYDDLSNCITTRFEPPTSDTVSATFINPSFSNIDRRPG
ncbi:hypothetical protein BSP239C_01977 [Brevibacterium sp. 239c]|nr:hypothetical protein BSP239C_01977 [Brevibacterium sp. 239c]